MYIHSRSQDQKPKLFAEDVLVESRRLEDARFPSPKRGQTPKRASPAVRRETVSPADTRASYSPTAASSTVVTNVNQAILVPPHPHFAPGPYPAGTGIVAPEGVPGMAPAPTWSHAGSGVHSVSIPPSVFAFYAESLYGEDGSMGEGDSSMYLDAQALLPTYSNTSQGSGHGPGMLPGSTWGLPPAN